MKRGYLSFVVFLVILIGPVIALNFGGTNTLGWLGERTAAFTPQPPTSAQEIAAEPTPEDPFQWLSDRPAVREVFIPDELTAARYIGVEKIIRHEELLVFGEAQPADNLRELYAAARAPAQLIEYCADILATIGTSCDVIRTEARENREGKWVLDGHLAYIPIADLGTPETVANGQLISTKAMLPFEGDLRPPNDAQTRTDMLQRAQSVCDRLRAQLGNCVLTLVAFDLQELWITDLEALPAGTNPQRLTATAEFTVYADPAQLDDTAFADLVASLMNAT
ncbi:hypothetical protein QTO30_09250 [Yoonia sp. GPGPB17]|uniref:hypothetical protein n=1 Tax=Yoonia sp. GPGPB17 TaxID=3026147 RepID=UPI0030C1C710